MKSGRGDFLVEAAAALLREGMSGGRWHLYLPGLRQLRAELGISRPTLEKALAVLSDEGWVTEATHGQRREILMGRTGVPAIRRRLGLVVPECWNNEEHNDVKFAHGLQLALERQDCQLILLKEEAARSARFSEWLGMAGPADAWVIYSGRRRLVEQFLLHAPRTLAIGGAVADLAIDVVAWDGDSLVTEAVCTLLRAGHRRIVMPVMPSWQDGPHGGMVAFRREMQAVGLPVQASYHLPPAHDCPQRFRELLEALWRWTPPTALILHNKLQAIDLMCFLAARNLSIPRDVSVIALFSDPLLGELSPAISVMETDNTRLVQHVVNWFLHRPAPPRKILLPATLVERQSVAPPRCLLPAVSREGA